MRRARILFYLLMVLINIIPFISLSMKGILGLIFIIISCGKLGLKDGIYTAILWVLFGFANYMLGINVDYEHGIATMLIGTLLYFVTVLYFGKTITAYKSKNDELVKAVELREKTERELKEKLTLMQSLMDTIPSPIFFKGLDLKYIGCNRAFENSIGITETEMTGKYSYELYEDQSADINNMDNELLAEMGKQVYETVVKFHDGSLRNVIFNKTIFTDEAGRPKGIVGVMTDITDKKESEELKRRVNESKIIMDEILEHDKLKTEFFSNISHELRTPLNVILGSIQLVDTYLKDDLYDISQDKVTRNIAIMKQNCYRLLKLVNNLIDITRIDANAINLNIRNCNIVSIVEEIALAVSDYIKDKGVSLIFDTNVEERFIACDDEKIERVLLNLLSNAVKFTPDGGNILVHVSDKGDRICIRVSDDGIGIAHDKTEEIFKRFCQIDSMFTRQHEGSGIGLNLIKSLVEMHGGTIRVESELGKGTTFIIELPVKLCIEEEVQYQPIAKQAYKERVSIEFSDIFSLTTL